MVAISVLKLSHQLSLVQAKYVSPSSYHMEFDEVSMRGSSLMSSIYYMPLSTHPLDDGN